MSMPLPIYVALVGAKVTRLDEAAKQPPRRRISANIGRQSETLRRSLGTGVTG
jgi:hypothetical protein